MRAYKLFRELKTGEITSLFIDRSNVLPVGQWLDAQEHPTKGFAFRPGWHCTSNPEAPHLKMELANGEKRVWYEVEIEDYYEMNRPKSQGGLWYLGKRMKINKKV